MKVAFQFVVGFAHQVIMPIVRKDLIMKNGNVTTLNAPSLINGPSGQNAVSHVVVMANNHVLDIVLLVIMTIALVNQSK